MTNENQQQTKEVAERQAEKMNLDLSQGAFSSVDHFTQAYNMARYLCQSSMVPKQYQGQNNIGNCIIALEMAQRMGASPFAVMQNLDVIRGSPSWRSQFVIASLNSCGRFSPLRYKMEGSGNERTAIAWAYDRATGEVLEGPPVSIQTAIDEGWYDKDGSKWKTIPELMLRYRAAKWFGNLYAPDITMGMHDDTEVRDIIDVQGQDQGPVNQSDVADLNDQILNGPDKEQEEPVQPSEDAAPDQGPEQPAEASTEGAQDDEPTTVECPAMDDRPVSKQYCNETCQSRQGCPEWE